MAYLVPVVMRLLKYRFRIAEGGHVVRITSIKLSILASLVVATLAIAPMASADSFTITANNLGLSGTLGTVTTTQNGSNVDVTITMSPGFALVTQGGFLGFDTTGGLVLTNSSLTNFSTSGMSDSLIANVSIGGLGVLGLENPITSTGALDLSFTLPGVPSQINVQGTLVWANVQKMAGIRFTQLAPETQRVLREWLIQKQNEEGWRALDSPS